MFRTSGVTRVSTRNWTTIRSSCPASNGQCGALAWSLGSLLRAGVVQSGVEHTGSTSGAAGYAGEEVAGLVLRGVGVHGMPPAWVRFPFCINSSVVLALGFLPPKIDFGFFGPSAGCKFWVSLGPLRFQRGPGGVLTNGSGLLGNCPSFPETGLTCLSGCWGAGLGFLPGFAPVPGRDAGPRGEARPIVWRSFLKVRCFHSPPVGSTAARLARLRAAQFGEQWPGLLGRRWGRAPMGVVAQGAVGVLGALGTGLCFHSRAVARAARLRG